MSDANGINLATSLYDKWAAVLTGYSVVVEPGQTVSISGGSDAAPLIRAVYRQVLKRGGFPAVNATLPGLTPDLYQLGSDEQLSFITPTERFERERADVSIHIIADVNTKALTDADPSRHQQFQRARADLIKLWLQRAASGEHQWTITLFPTDAYAQDAGMSTEAFADFVFKAGKLDQPDPIAAWKAQAAEQQRLIDWLEGKSEIHLTGPDTDLKLSYEGRTWINADGRRNFPDGEIFTGPVETSTEGHVRFSYPVVVAGREVSDVRLRFEAGTVTDASAAQNEAFLIQQLDADAGSRILGEFAFGTNFDIQRFIKNILFDEKIGGTVHMAVGAGYPDTGSTNESMVHWDLICDLREGRVTVDGEDFLVGGRYVV